MDSAAEREFDALAHAASAFCGTPIALISLVDAERQWFKANVGLEGVSQTPRELAFCAHAIQGDDVMEVPDATQDPRFAENPLVTGQPDIRFYAGAPLHLSNGARVGTLCVIDREPRQLSDTQREVLAHLATAAVQALEARAALRELDALRGSKEKSEQRFAALAQVAPVGVFATDMQGACTMVNLQWQTIYGLSMDQALGHGWSATLHPDDRSLVVRHWQEAVAALEDFDLRFRIQRPDGSLRLVHVHARPVREINNEVTGYVGSVVDETERSVSIDGLLDTITDHFLLTTTDLDGRIIDINEAKRRLSGYPREAVIGQHIEMLRSGQQSPEFFAHIQAEISSGRSWRGEISNRDSQGELYWIDTVMAPLFGLSGNIERCVSIGTNITRRKEQESQLARAQLLLQRTSEVSGVGGWEVEIGSDGPNWSDQTCRIHGVPPGYKPTLEEAIAFFAPEARPVISQAVSESMQTGGSWDLELPLIRKDGRRIWARAVGGTQMKDGKPVRLYGAFQDVTERSQQTEALKEAYERMALATGAGGIGVWVLDVTSGVLNWDAQMHHLYDRPEGGPPVAYGDWSDRLHPEDRGRAEGGLRLAHETGQPFSSEFRVIWRDGSVRHIKAAAQVIRDSEGQDVRMIGVNWDVTEVRELSQRVANQKELLRVTLASIGDAVITTDVAGKVTWLNPVAERLTGWSTDDAMGKDVLTVFHIVNETTRELTDNPVLHCLREGKIVGLANHTVLIARDGSEYGIEDSAAPIFSASDEVLGAVLVFHDVTEQRRLSGEMSYRATHDPLTGLLNRDEIDVRLRGLLQKAHSDDSQHALLYIDLDQFKVVNDSCGHSAGDELLQRVAKLMQEVLRSRDILARLGGDEFGVLLEHCTTEQAMRVAQKICDAMEQFRFVHADQRFRIGASIGLVPVDRRFATSALVMQAADAACYAAKEGGRNRVHEWVEADAHMEQRHAQMQWATRLEQALDDDAFVLFAQRILPLKSTDSALHAEVLLRLPDGRGGYYAPGLFLPAAERYHLASRIDRWVLRQVITQLHQWPPHLAMGLMSINLSGQSVGDRAFHKHALVLLEEAGPSLCSHVCLEITETAAITNIADASQFVRRVRELGVRVALDDFGAGASSFGYLKQLKVDFIKIDGQFVKDVLDDELDAAAVRSFVEVARVVGVETVAEFVDRAEVLSWISDLGVDHAQGYHLHKPEPLKGLLRPST